MAKKEEDIGRQSQPIIVYQFNDEIGNFEELILETNVQLKDLLASEIIKEGWIDGLQTSLARIRKLRDNGSDVYFDEISINGIGYYLMNSGKIREAIEVFKLNVEIFPKSFNVYDFLGEAYMKSGDNENAIKNYRKSLELNPDNNNAREMLKKLEKK